MKIRKEENKTAFIHRQRDCTCRKSKGSTDKLLKLIYQFSTSTGNKGNIQKKSVVFLYTGNKQIVHDMKYNNIKRHQLRINLI